MGINHLHTSAILGALVLLTACDPTRRVPQGDALLKRNVIKVTESSVPASELETILKQKPNRRILWVPFYLHVYNLPDPEKVTKWREKKNARRDRKNERRAAKGKDEKPYKPTTAEWLRSTVGEAPVILDSNQTKRSNEQIRLYMAKEGWFRATVEDTVLLRHGRWFGGKLKHPKAIVRYQIDPGPEYRFRTITLSVDDPTIRGVVMQDWANSLLKPGDRFDDDVIDNERTRVADHLRDQGYLFFSRELINFDADTAVGEHEVDLVMHLSHPGKRDDQGLAGTREGTKYRLKEVFVATNRPSKSSSHLPLDTLLYSDYRFLYKGELAYKPKALLHPIFLHPNELYRLSDATRTQRRLTGLNVFDRVDITYDTTGTGGPGLANARISLIPGKTQNTSLELYGTSRGGAYGLSTSLGYKHRNLFGTLGSIQLQMVLGLEAQQRLTGSGPDQVEQSSGTFRTGSLFNTISLGPEVTVAFPRPFARFFSKSSGSQLLFNALYNYQQRPDYTRSLVKVSTGVQWKESAKNTIGIFPLEANVIQIPQRSAAFEDYLRLVNDPVLQNSYTDHLIVGMRSSFVSSPPEAAHGRNAFFARVGLEWAGHPLFVPLRELGVAAQDTSGNTFVTLAGVRFAEFVKLDSDLRWRHTIHERSSLAFRVSAGVGVPYGNLTVLPFESSFFVGGANGLRAWRSRSIGPGSYSGLLQAFDRTGEARLEANAEYRFKLIGFLEGALFTDVGNIWNLQDDPRRPGGQLSSDLLSELAVGTGFGARLNFEFFIVRFDLGLQTKDPSLPAGERWLFQPKSQHEAEVEALTGQAFNYKPVLNFNLGIGYPF